MSRVHGGKRPRTYANADRKECTHRPFAHRGGSIELRISSVCVSWGLPSTGGSFLPPLAPYGAFFSLVLSSEGVSYLTSDCSGGPGISPATCSSGTASQSGAHSSEHSLGPRPALAHLSAPCLTESIGLYRLSVYVHAHACMCVCSRPLACGLRRSEGRQGQPVGSEH